jgi:hypothetical protein
MAGIQEIFSSNCTTPAIDIDLSKVTNRNTAMVKGNSVKKAAIYLISLAERRGKMAMITAPASGRKVIVDK